MVTTRIALLGNPCFPAAQSRRRDFLEVVLVYALILVVLWTPSPWQVMLWGISIVSIVALICVSFDGLKSMGFCTDNFRESLWAVGLSILLSAAAVFFAWKLHTLHFPGSPFLFVRHYGAYAVWAFLQQILLQCFLLSRLLRLLPDPRLAAVVAALLFAGTHLPSPVLTVVTLVCGLAACLLFVRYRTLYPLALAHAILGIAIGITVPAAIDHNMLVGRSYLTYGQKTASIPAVAHPSPSPLAQPVRLP
jgi:hypothetical protein